MNTRSSSGVRTLAGGIARACVVGVGTALVVVVAWAGWGLLMMSQGSGDAVSLAMVNMIRAVVAR